MVRLLAIAILGAVVLLAAEAGAADLTLTWTDNSQVETGQDILSCTPATVGGTCTPSVKQIGVAANVQTFTDTNLAERVTKCYTVRATAGTDVSNPSNVACGTTKLNAPTGAAVAN